MAYDHLHPDDAAALKAIEKQIGEPLREIAREKINDPTKGFVRQQGRVIGLSVWGTKVSDLVPLSGLRTLKSLDTSHTQVGDLSPLSSLRTLQMLRVRYTQVSDLGPLSGLRNLQILDVLGTKISDLIPLSGLRALQRLTVNSTQVIDLVPLSGLRALQRLDVSRTQVSDLVPLSGLSALQALEVSGTQVSDLSPLSGLSALQLLDVRSTQVIDLVPLSGLSSLRLLKIKDTPAVKGIPAEVLAGKEGHTLVRAILDYRAHEKKPLNELRIILLGEGESGKTTLIRSLINPAYCLEKPAQTVGGYREKMVYPILQQDFTFHLWEFGGQETQHATHSIFLSNRCVYVVLQPTRTGNSIENPLEYWLEMVQSFAPEAPIIVAYTKRSEGDSWKADENGIKGRYYPYVQAFIEIPVLIDSFGREQLDTRHILRAIEDALNAAPELNAPFIGSEVQVKQRMEEIGKSYNYLPIKEFGALCRKIDAEWFADPTEGERRIQQVAGVLHNLGTVVFFPETYLLNQLQVLNPEWVTRALYTLITHKDLKDSQGVWEEKDLGKLLPDKNTYPPETYGFIVALMEKFELCYATTRNGKSAFHVPGAFSENTPEAVGAWQEDGCLRFAYHYATWFSKILHRLMAKDVVYPLLDESRTWRNGFVIQHGGCEAFVRHRKEGTTNILLLSVRGGGERSKMLYTLRSLLESIHGDYSEAFRKGIVEQIPFAGGWQSYRDLSALLREGITLHTLVVNGTVYRDVDLQQLLTDYPAIGNPKDGNFRGAITANNIIFNAQGAMDLRAWNAPEPEPVVLFFSAQPLDSNPLGLGDECRALHAICKQHQWALEPKFSVRLEDMAPALAAKPRIVHFAGHGVPGAARQIGNAHYEDGPGLRLHRNAHTSFDLKAEDLAAFLRPARPEVVLLNACHSLATANVVKAALPEATVIGTTGELPDDLALLFAQAFYGALFAGAAAAEAFEAARTGLRAQGREERLYAMA